MLKFKRLGVTEEITSCDCCGRANLKLTVCLENNETGELVHYGRFCAARAEGWGIKPADGTKLQKEIIAQAKQAFEEIKWAEAQSPSGKAAYKEKSDFWADQAKGGQWRETNKEKINEAWTRWQYLEKQARLEAMSIYCKANKTTPERTALLIRSYYKGFNLAHWT